MNDESYMDSDEIEEMPDEPVIDMLVLLERMQQQLTFLEKKIDMLLNRTEGERTFDAPRQAPKPYRRNYDSQTQRSDRPPRRFDRPPRRERNDGEDRDRSYREKESSRDNYFDRRRTIKKTGGKPKPRTGHGKKPFYSRYNDR